MSSDKIWLSPPCLSGNERRYVAEAFDSNWITPMGPHVDAFEREIANYLSVPHVAALSSGTAALHLALILSGVQKGDVVLCQSLTFAASANPILYLNAIPVFIGSEEETWNISPESFKKALLSLAERDIRPKALIAVDIFGMPANYEKISAICNEFGVTLIEDAAEALGSRIGKKMAGSFGHMSVLSFNGNKIITTSGGGALCSNDQKITQKGKFLATQARDPAPHYEHSQVGYNYRMSNVCAAIGRGQLENIEDKVKKRRYIFKYYFEKLNQYERISFLDEPPNFFSNRWLSVIRVSPDKNRKITWDKIKEKLDSDNIESRPVWKPLHLQPIFSKYEYFGDYFEEKLFSEGLCLPSGHALTDEDLDRICSHVISSVHS